MHQPLLTSTELVHIHGVPSNIGEDQLSLVQYISTITCYCINDKLYGLEQKSLNGRVVMSKNPITRVFGFLGGFLHTKTQGGFLLFCVFL